DGRLRGHRGGQQQRHRAPIARAKGHAVPRVVDSVPQGEQRGHRQPAEQRRRSPESGGESAGRRTCQRGGGLAAALSQDDSRRPRLPAFCAQSGAAEGTAPQQPGGPVRRDRCQTLKPERSLRDCHLRRRCDLALDSPRMKANFFCCFIVALMAGISAGAAPSETHARADLPGTRPDGSVLLPNQWVLRPAGRQVELGNFPVNIAVHPRGRYAAVLHSGYGRHEIVIVDVKRAAVVSRTPVHETFYGLAFSANGRHLYCSGAGDEVVHDFMFESGVATNDRPIRVHDAEQRGIPCGLAVSAEGQRLYTANAWGQRVSEVDLLAKTNRGDIVFDSTDENLAGGFARSGDASADVAAVTKRAEAALDPTSPDAPFPYDCVLDE